MSFVVGATTFAIRRHFRKYAGNMKNFKIIDCTPAREELDATDDIIKDLRLNYKGRDIFCLRVFPDYISWWCAIDEGGVIDLEKSA